MAKKALISPNETLIEYVSSWTQVDGEYKPVLSQINNAQRIVQVEEEANVFNVASPLYWKDCADSVEADKYYLNTTNDTIIAKPQDVEKPTE